jgi:glycosyltransferase involved in cell wall biosynthesis
MIRDHRPMQPRPRVLAVAQSASLGGAELALIRIAERLPELGFDVELAFPGPVDGIPRAGSGKQRPGSGMQRRGSVAWTPPSVHRLPVGGIRPGAWPRAVAGWPRARALARRFDLVLLNGIVTQRLAPAMSSATLVPYIHELSDSPPRAWRSSRFWSAAPVVLCACDAVAQRCRAFGAPEDRLRTVYAPVEAVDPAPQPDWADRPVVGFVGRIQESKGVRELVQAMRDVDARLVVVGDGDGPYADQVRAAPGVVFTGPVEDARPLMPWFDVLALPSHVEAFGTVAAEALAAGTPVVATRSGGVQEYVVPGRNGELVMPGDVEGLADALRRVLPQASSMADAAREDAARFRTDVVARSVADALSDALAARGLDASSFARSIAGDSVSVSDTPAGRNPTA